jgi:hypothetical protein
LLKNQFPSERHKRLNVLAGVWDTTITTLNSDGSEGGASKATDTYKWMPNGFFLLHDVDAIMGGRNVQSLEILAVDQNSENFVSRSYDADGSINDFTSRIEGRAYTISGRSQRFAGEFSEDGKTLTGQWEQFDNDRWSPLIKITLRKRF